MMGWFEVVLVALLPLTALFAVLQTQPYSALILRGIMGTLAVLLYAVLGAPDVALTEALVGTLLTVILFIVAVRSSLVMRVGRLSNSTVSVSVRKLCARHRLSLRESVYESEKELVAAIKAGGIDAVCADYGSVPALHPLFENGLSAEQSIIVVAEHGRWHERQLKTVLHESELFARLRYRERGGIR